MDVRERVLQIQKMLNKHGIQGFLQPANDEFMNEYPPACNRRLEWLTGFTGSAGTVAVLEDKCAFFTDGRYTLQAAAELDAQIFSVHNNGELTPEAWLAAHAGTRSHIGYDARLYTPDTIRRMQQALDNANIALVACPNFVDELWHDRPAPCASPLIVHTIAYCGETSESKRRRVAETIGKAGAQAALITAPDSVNWLLNIRGNDTEHSPLALSAALLDANGRAQLFVSPSRCGAEVLRHLGNEVTVCDPASLEAALAALGKEKAAVLCDQRATSIAYTEALTKAGAKLVNAPDPCVLPKAIKNATELAGMEAAHTRDGAAVVKLLHWLDTETSRRDVSELEVCEALHRFRAQDSQFHSPSFSTISGSGGNGAIVHYRATDATNRILRKGELFLLDSGGQYPEGTTDITRTVPIGIPGEEHRDRFTRVLKGHIAIAAAQFPEGTCGSQIDALARQYLWQAGLDYDHGTGHGVGCFLNVHEGPQRISKRGGDAQLAVGMVVSNEPGYYKSGEYGIRIENLVAVSPRRKGENGKAYFGFDTLTCVPIDTRLVEASMLTVEEEQWLNAYHAWVESQLRPLLDDAPAAWLHERCKPV